MELSLASSSFFFLFVDARVRVIWIERRATKSRSHLQFMVKRVEQENPQTRVTM